jgi:hypothetical protein
MSGTKTLPVTFKVRHSTAEFFVLIAMRGGGSYLTVMEPTAEGSEVTVRLPPGVYRYRYYLVKRDTTVYFSPRDAADGFVEMDGLDAVLRVPRREPRWQVPSEIEVSQLMTSHLV